MSPKYLAGIIDGEGCICVSSRKGVNGKLFYASLSISNTDENLIHDLRQEFGGTLSVDDSPPYKMSYTLNWQGDKMRKILSMTLPFLRIKKEQSENALSCQGLSPMGRGLLYCRNKKLNARLRQA